MPFSDTVVRVAQFAHSTCRPISCTDPIGRELCGVKLNATAPREVQVYDIVTAPRRVLHPATIAWLWSQQPWRQPVDPDVEYPPWATRHPVVCAVHGFASAIATVGEDEVELALPTMVVGAEPHVILAASERLHRHAGVSVNYEGKGATLSMMQARARMLGSPSEHIFRSVVKNCADLADCASISGQVIAPLPVFVHEIGLGPYRTPLTTRETATDLQAGYHDRLVAELVWRLEATSQVLALLYVGERLPVRWRDGAPA